MQKSNSYHLKTPRKHRTSQMSSKELLEKLNKIKSESVQIDDKVVYETKRMKSLPKSIIKGSQSYREQNINQYVLKSNEDLNSTVKKSQHVKHISQIWSMRNRTDSNVQTPKQTEKQDFIHNANAFLRQKTLENKLDQLTYQVLQLKKKSDQLEIQNKLLFENITQYQQDRENSKDRNALVSKLDQMIIMQQRQEENLNYFKSLFSQNEQMRRVKTQQSYPKLRSVGISTYL